MSSKDLINLPSIKPDFNYFFLFFGESFSQFKFLINFIKEKKYLPRIIYLKI